MWKRLSKLFTKRNIIIWSIVGAVSGIGMFLAFYLNETEGAKEARLWDRGDYKDVCPPINWRCHSSLSAAQCKGAQDAVDEFNKQAGRKWFVKSGGKLTVEFHAPKDEMNTPAGLCYAKYSVEGHLGQTVRHKDAWDKTTGFTLHICWNKVEASCTVMNDTAARKICQEGYQRPAKHELGHVAIGGKYIEDNPVMRKACADPLHGCHPRWSSGFMNADAPTASMSKVTKLILEKAWKDCKAKAQVKEVK